MSRFSTQRSSILNQVRISFGYEANNLVHFSFGGSGRHSFGCTELIGLPGLLHGPLQTTCFLGQCGDGMCILRLPAINQVRAISRPHFPTWGRFELVKRLSQNAAKPCHVKRNSSSQIHATSCCDLESERQDLNLRSLHPQCSALPG